MDFPEEQYISFLLFKYSENKGNLKCRNKAPINNKFNLIKTNWDQICMCFKQKKITAIYWYIEGTQSTYSVSAFVAEIINPFHRVHNCD